MTTKKQSRPNPSPTAKLQPAKPRSRPDWRWRSFPVFAAFAAGMLIAFVVNEGTVNPVAFVLQLVALLGVGYSLAHLLVTNVIAAGRTRRDREDETEDVIIHPDEA